MEDEDYWNLSDKIDYISMNVILPIFVSVGLVANIFTFCAWVFGSKSKYMCCAVYFAANSAVDFLVLTYPLFRNNYWQFSIPKTDFTCKLFVSFYRSVKHLTTCISAIITVERSLTILFPFVFKPQDMRKRSKIVLLVILILQPFMQFITFYYVYAKDDDCVGNAIVVNYGSVFHAFVIILIPFAIIILFNVATVAALIRSRRHAVSGHRDHVAVFTKLTLLTGVSFVLSYTIAVVITMYVLLDLEEFPRILDLMLSPSYTMWLFNSAMNPIICMIVCKSVREDIALFVRAVGRRFRRQCTCRGTPSEIPASGASGGTAGARATEETASRNADTSAANANVATTPV